MSSFALCNFASTPSSQRQQHRWRDLGGGGGGKEALIVISGRGLLKTSAEIPSASCLGFEFNDFNVKCKDQGLAICNCFNVVLEQSNAACSKHRVSLAPLTCKRGEIGILFQASHTTSNRLDSWMSGVDMLLSFNDVLACAMTFGTTSVVDSLKAIALVTLRRRGAACEGHRACLLFVFRA